jgi:PAS domain S-box-containing protein
MLKQGDGHDAGPPMDPKLGARDGPQSAGSDRVQQILDAVLDPFLVVDRDARVTLVNRRAVQLLGVGDRDVRGRALAELVPADLAARIEAEARTGEDGAPFLGTLAAGREFEIRVHAAGDGASVAFRDVTERKAADELRARLERQASLRADVSGALARGGTLRQVLQLCSDAIVENLGAAFARVWTVDAEGTTLELQASSGMYTHIEGGHARVPVGAFKIGMIAAEKRPHLTNDVQHDPRVGDREWAKREGMVAFAGYPLMVDDRCVGVMAMFARHALAADTVAALASVADAMAQGLERLRAEMALEHRADELARSNAELERFAYVASHDLQEPLRMVASYTQLLARRYQDKLDADANEFIGYAVDGVTRMQALINDLLAYSRVGTRGKEFAVTRLDECLQRALANLRLAVEQSGASVSHDALPTVVGDEGQLAQVFQNLVGNALKFRGTAAPKVHVSARKLEGGAWEVCVRDNGIGIAPEYFDKVFVIFQRLHTRSDYSGNGIGLAICKKIVERHGGTIWIESQPPSGTAVHFTLPAPIRRPAGRHVEDDKREEGISVIASPGVEA